MNTKRKAKNITFRNLNIKPIPKSKEFIYRQLFNYLNNVPISSLTIIKHTQQMRSTEFLARLK